MSGHGSARQHEDAVPLYHKKDSKWRKKWRPALEHLQGGVCCICRRPPPILQRVLDRLNDTPWGPQTDETLSKLWIDHDHETGMVRGLLCADCNAAIMALEGYDLQEHAAAARQYLDADGRRERAKAHLRHKVRIVGTELRLFS